MYQATLGKDQLHKFFHRFQPLISEINTEKHNFFFSEINTEKHNFSIEYDFSGRFERFFYIFIIGLRMQNAELLYLQRQCGEEKKDIAVRSFHIKNAKSRRQPEIKVDI